MNKTLDNVIRSIFVYIIVADMTIAENIFMI